jgi:capsular exopolysaccharide synthesis family protein
MSAADPNKNGTNGQPTREAGIQTSVGSLTTPPPALSAAPTASNLLKALQRRAVLATTLGVLFTAAAVAAVWFFLPPAKRIAFVQLKLDSSLWNPIGQPREDPRFFTWRDTQIALIKNRLVLQRALNEPKVRQLAIVQNTVEPVDWLEKEIKVDLPTGPEILRINLNGDNPEELKILVDAIAEAFLAEFHDTDRKYKRDRLDYLENSRRDYEDKLKEKRKDKEKLAAQLNAGNNDALTQIRLQAEAERGVHAGTLVRLKAELVGLEAELRLFNQQDRNAIRIARSQVEARVNRRPEIAKILHELDDLDLKIQKNKQVATNPQVANKEYLDKRAKLEAELENARKELYSKEEAALRSDLANNATNHLENLQGQIERNKMHQKMLEDLIAKIDEKNPRLVKGQLEFAVFDQEIEMYKEIVNNLNKEINFARAEFEAAPQRIKKLGEPISPRSEETARKIKYAAMAGFATLGAVLVLISFLEFRTRRIMSVDEVVHGLGMRLMGTLPAHPTRPMSASSAAHTSFQTMLAESVDSARTMLLHAARAGSMRIVMVTSATSGEGKTSLASHLAVSLARAGRKTLLVDCDLRNPAAHRLFELPLEPGFSEVLRGEVELENAIRPTKAAGLSLLSTGIPDSESLQLLAQDGPKAIFAQLRADYDFIIIDSSPVLPVADALLIAQYMDGVIFSILRDVSRMPKVYAAYQKLATLDAPLLGAVVNGTQEELYGYGPRYLVGSSNGSNHKDG